MATMSALQPMARTCGMRRACMRARCALCAGDEGACSRRVGADLFKVDVHARLSDEQSHAHGPDEGPNVHHVLAVPHRTRAAVPCVAAAGCAACGREPSGWRRREAEAGACAVRGVRHEVEDVGAENDARQHLAKNGREINEAEATPDDPNGKEEEHHAR